MSKVHSNTMAFYHEDGIVSAWKQASRFAGKNGRIGTMLDVVDARIATGVNDIPWNTYYTTTSAEYFGYGADGKRKLIIAHGVGPMSTIGGILKAYSFQFNDKTRQNNGGRISQEEFLKLEDGEYGNVFNADDMRMLDRGEFEKIAIVDFDKLVETYEYPFLGYLSVKEALREPLLRARLGNKLNEYLLHHAAMARKIHIEEHGTDIEDPYIVQMGDPSNCPYTTGGWHNHPRQYPWLDKEDGAIAHLLSTGCLVNACHERERRANNSIANNIGIHEWSDGVRLVAVKDGTSVTNIHQGFNNVHKKIIDNWRKVLKSTSKKPYPSETLHVLVENKGDFFIQYPKDGPEMDTAEPEFHVKSAKRIGDPVKFVTKTLGYHGFFKYDIRDVEKIKPADANAYILVSDPENIWHNGSPTHQSVYLQFYKVNVDTSKRIMRADEVRNDYNLMMKIL